MALITPEILEDVERSLALLLPYDLRSILRQMAMRNPQDFLQIVRASPPPSEPLQNRNVGEERIYRTPDELQENPELLQRCTSVAIRWLQQQKVISAIKEIREISGLGLKDAKEFVQSLPQYAALRSQYESRY